MVVKKQMIIAHRGASGLVEHENTFNSFLKAIEIGADAIELDIRKTREGNIIVYHDQKAHDILIKDLTYEQLLKKKQYHVPTLEEVLILCKGRILLDIELKETGYEQEIIDLILKHLNYDQFFIRSFDDQSLKTIKDIDQKIKTGLILGVEHPKHAFLTRMSELFPIFRINKTKCDFVSPYYKLVILGFTRRLHFWKIPVFVWTVNEKGLMKKLLHNLKVDGIVTDYPNKGIEVLKDVV